MLPTSQYRYSTCAWSLLYTSIWIVLVARNRVVSFVVPGGGTPTVPRRGASPRFPRVVSIQDRKSHYPASLSDILQQLDDRNIKYAPTDTKQQLWRKLQQAKETTTIPLKHIHDNPSTEKTTASSIGGRHLNPSNTVSTTSTQNPSQRRTQRRTQRRRMQGEQQPAWIKVTDQARSVAVRKATRVWDRASRKARKIARQATEMYYTDQDGIRDVKYEYLSRDQQYLSPRKQTQSPPQERRRQSPHITAAKRPNVAPNLTINTQTSKPRIHSIPIDPKSTPKQDHMYKRTTKKIYSPYADVKVDLFGQFRAQPQRKETNPSQDSADAQHRRSGQHWKDRLEEQLDTILGIHEEGEYYNSWMKREKNEMASEEEDYDAFSVARGRRPKRRHESVKKFHHDKPFWEEEGNLISLLFGKTNSGKSMMFEKLLDKQTGSLVNLFQSLLRSLAIVVSYLCRWASVRGSLPQSVVVVGLCTAGLCGRKKLRAMAIALVAMRTLGELIHGAIYDSEDWHDAEEFHEETSRE